MEPAAFGPLLDTEKVLHFLYRRRRKLSAVVVTGGEPTLQEDLIPFLKILKAMRFKIKLDTNGALPNVLCKVIQAGVLDYIAMDLKAPLMLYPSLTQTDVDPNSIMRSMEIIRLSGVEYEFRTTFAPEMLSWKNLYEIQDLLLPGDPYYLQECHYSTTLEDLKMHDFGDQKLVDHEEYFFLLSKAQENRIKINLRA
ncbi:MAG TPA: radical SAM protein [Candidatus Cloacimonadota bacterium]|nr:radical SAM protein [Candidatus Cloacimonadota bacterium]